MLHETIMSVVDLDYGCDASVTRRPSRALYIFSCFMVAATLGLIAAGGMITSTGSGLSVPDWPTTYGENMFTFPFSKWTGGIFYEHSHRLIASTVGFLTIILAVWLHIAKPSRMLKILGWCALAAVIVQGVLGGLTVLYLLPTWISVLHGCVAQSFLCILVTIAVALGRQRHSANGQQSIDSPYSSTRAPSSMWAFALVLVVFGQLIAGAIMRHTESGLAVPDFPAMYGSYWPGLSNAAMERYNESRAFDYQLLPVTRAQVAYHLVHRGGAVFVVIATLLALWSYRRHSASQLQMRAVRLIALLVFTQAGLGIATVLLRKPPMIATAHVVVGAATLAASWRLFLHVRWSPRTLPNAAAIDSKPSALPASNRHASMPKTVVGAGS